MQPWESPHDHVALYLHNGIQGQFTEAEDQAISMYALAARVGVSEETVRATVAACLAPVWEGLK